jgi:hypothetical protein
MQRLEIKKKLEFLFIFPDQIQDTKTKKFEMFVFFVTHKITIGRLEIFMSVVVLIY